ncbi:MAG: beta-glucuronidase [Lachnospiraceae bacterium]|nr:beta-glucuronidase [Lachnospiraceae bacterium]
MEKSLLYPRQTASRRVVSMNGMWKFQFDSESTGIASDWENGLPESVSMPVPSSFCDLFTDKDSREYTGDFWYETDFFVPGEWMGNEVLIRFGSATHKARVFVNGLEVGQHVGGFLPFNVRVTEIVRYNQYNKLTVLMNNELSETMIPCGTTKTLSNGKKMSLPYFDFYNYAGLQRPVSLLMLPKETITDFTVNHTLSGKDAVVDYTVTTNGNHEVSVTAKDESGTVVAEASGTKGSLLIKDARLWNVHQSYLYTFTVRIINGNQIIDEYFDRIGIRTFEIQNGHFLLNGNPVYLKGFGRHEDSDIRGRGLDLPTIKRDYECMKWIGANCFRTSHYPYAEEMYYMADEEGFLVIDEVPAVGMMQSVTNFLAANRGNQIKETFFEKETTPQLLEHHKECIREMISRDKNHASVIAWSLLNEPQTTHETSAPYFEEVFSYAKELDVQKRPCTFAVIMMSTPDTCKCWQFCDFVSLNRYYGWYMLGGYQMSDAEEAFRKEMDAWGRIRGDRPFIFTEYGADTYFSEHKLPSVMWSQEYQDEYLDMNHKVFDSYPWVQGELVWNFADFQTTEGIMRANGNKKGIFTRQRQPKDAAYLFKARWENMPVDYKCGK